MTLIELMNLYYLHRFHFVSIEEIRKIFVEDRGVDIEVMYAIKSSFSADAGENCHLVCGDGTPFVLADNF